MISLSFFSNGLQLQFCTVLAFFLHQITLLHILDMESQSAEVWSSFWCSLEYSANLIHWTAAMILVIGLLAALLLWRLWRFTVYPWIHPSDAKELPYWIPCT